MRMFRTTDKIHSLANASIIIKTDIVLSGQWLTSDRWHRVWGVWWWYTSKYKKVFWGLWEPFIYFLICQTPLRRIMLCNGLGLFENSGHPIRRQPTFIFANSSCQFDVFFSIFILYRLQVLSPDTLLHTSTDDLCSSAEAVGKCFSRKPRVSKVIFHWKSNLENKSKKWKVKIHGRWLDSQTRLELPSLFDWV